MPGLPKEQIKKREALRAQHPELIVEAPKDNILIPIHPEAPRVEELRSTRRCNKTPAYMASKTRHPN